MRHRPSEQVFPGRRILQIVITTRSQYSFPLVQTAHQSYRVRDIIPLGTELEQNHTGDVGVGQKVEETPRESTARYHAVGHEHGRMPNPMEIVKLFAALREYFGRGNVSQFKVLNVSFLMIVTARKNYHLCK